MTKLKKALILAMAFAMLSGSALAGGTQATKQVQELALSGDTDDKKSDDKDDDKDDKDDDKDDKDDDKDKLEIKRIAGSNRAATAIEVSKAMFDDDDDSDYAILVSGTNTADALAAGPLAIELDAPILLATDSADLAKEIKRLDVDKLIIIGGESSVDKKFEKIFDDVEVKRIAGDNRYDTAVKIGEKLVDEFDYDKVALANGSNSVDALAAALHAEENSAVILLTPANTIPKEVKDFVAKEDIDKVYAIGGENSVNEKAGKELGKKYDEKARIAGKNRYETAIKFADALDKDPEKVVLVSGDNAKLVDALAAAPFAEELEAPIILTAGDKLPAETAAYLKKESIEKIYIIGGEGTISPAVVKTIKNK